MEYFKLFENVDPTLKKESKTVGRKYTEKQLISMMKSNQNPIRKTCKKVVEIIDGQSNEVVENFLYEITMAESWLGAAWNTNSNPVDKGPWQINKVGLKGTKDIKSHPNYKDLHDVIKEETGIDWLNVTHEDCTKLIHGCLAARLVFKKFPKAFNFGASMDENDIKKRGHYWKKYYNTSAGKGSVEKYLERVLFVREKLSSV